MKSRKLMQSRGSLLLLCQHFYPELVSTGLNMTELARELAARGWSVEVCCARPEAVWDRHSQVPESEVYHGVNIKRVRGVGAHRGSIWSRLLFSLSYMLGAARYTDRQRKATDTILDTTNPPFIGLVAVVMRLLFHVPYIVVVHDVFPEIAVRLKLIRSGSWIEAAWRVLRNCVLRNSECVVVIGRDMKNVIDKVLSDNGPSVEIIPNWSDERTIRPVPRSENPFVQEHGLGERLVVQYSGNMGRTHNLECLLDAAEMLQSDERVVFQFVGDGAKRLNLEALASAKGLRNVQFLPYQPYERLPYVLSAAHLAVVVLESGFEGLSVPSKTYAVMAAGIPVLGLLAPMSEIGRTIEENECGVVISDATGAKVAAVVSELTTNPGRFREMGSNGRNAFLAKYSLAIAVEGYVGALEKIVKHPEGCPGLRSQGYEHEISVAHSDNTSRS